MRDAEAEAWRARSKHGSKGGRPAAASGDWLRNMAPFAKARYIRDANLKALYGISLPHYEELLPQTARTLRNLRPSSSREAPTRRRP